MIQFKSNKKQFAMLIDPGKLSWEDNKLRIDLAIKEKIDYFFIGGSLMSDNTIEKLLDYIKENSDIPCILYPGNSNQIHSDFDAILFMSLLSGRNPEYLIGQQVISAPIIVQSGVQAISTAYLLIANNNLSSVAYMSQTQPIPTHKTDIILATAMAADLLGFSCLFLDSGSGIDGEIPLSTISKIKQYIKKPIILGGGIDSAEKANKKWKAGADIIVVGNAIEKNPGLIREIAQARNLQPKTGCND
jgi:putative glycerol-1-phosphate prenyltransferase